MSKSFDTFGEKKLGNKLSQYGTGSYVRSAPEMSTARYDNFQAGYDASEPAQNVPTNASPSSINVYTDRKDRLARCPGTTNQYTYLATEPTQVVLHPSTNGRAELVAFTAPNLTIMSENLAAPTIINGGLLAVDNPYVWAFYGEDMIFMNGIGSVKKRASGELTVTDLPNFPQGSTLAVFAGRVMVGGAIIDGNFEPMGMRWPSPVGNYDFDGEDSGAELLLANDTSAGDRIVATRAINFDYLAILCRKSIWIGRRTSDPARPADFSQRVTGKGCVNEATARLTIGGVMYLGDEGVEIFDGNTSTNISAQINPEILPMDPDFIAACSAAYNPVSQLYYLFTPLRTYVYDCLRQRWHRRSMILKWGSIFAQQFHATLWSEAIGDWASQGTLTWADMAPKELDIPAMYFLGDNVDNFRQLHVETMDAFTMMDFVVQYLYSTALGEFKKNHLLANHRAIRLRYSDKGSIKLYLPNLEAEYEDVGTIYLPSAVAPRISQSPRVHTGMGVGVQIEILSDDPRIESIELDYSPRGPRVETAIIPIAPPPKPSGLVVVINSHSRATLTWDAVATATSYEIWRQLYNGAYELVGTSLTPSFIDRVNGDIEYNVALNLRRDECGLIHRDDFTQPNGAFAPGSQWTIQAGTTWAISSNRLTVKEIGTPIMYLNARAFRWKVRGVNGGGGGTFTDASLQYTMPDLAEGITQSLMTYATATGTFSPSIIGKRTSSSAGATMSLRFGDIDYQSGITTTSTIASGSTTTTGTHTYKFKVFDNSKMVWSDTVQRINSSSNLLNGVLGKPGVRLDANDLNVNNSVFWDNFFYYKTNTVICTGMPAGYKLRAQPSAAVVTSVAGTATLDLIGNVCPQTTIEVLDASNNVVRSITPTVGVYGGDEYVYI